VKIFGLMADRLGLPKTLLQIADQADRLHHLLILLLEEETGRKSLPVDRDDAKPLELADYPIILEELTRMFDIMADERTFLRYYHDYRYGSGTLGELRGARVPLESRLFSLVKLFVTLTASPDTPSSLTPDQLSDQLLKQAGGHWDQLLIGHLLDLIKEKQIALTPKRSHHKIKKEKS
jgi:response regulator RpfG family c-di-GMP phosphodiesterase